MENKDNKKSRRDFLKTGLALGAGSLAGIGLLSTISGVKAENGKFAKVLTADGKIMEVDTAHLKEFGKKTEADLQKRGRQGIAGRKWTMVIDLSKCRNARMCMAACQNAHELKPEQHHINVLAMQDADKTAPYFMPKPCQHCDNPPCTKVCPVNATFKRDDGIVLIDNERCIGCRFCIAACPYSARIFNWLEPKVAANDRPYDIELNVPQKRGTVSKCLFSADQLRVEKMPYCASACPNGVYWFGDINEDAVTNGTTKETVRFSELIRDNAGYTLLPELGTKPSVYYLPAKNRLFEFNLNGKNTIEQHEV
jgi:molybdopterin-containing oxidoreductase family iron-sulfur binding subunit